MVFFRTSFSPRGELDEEEHLYSSGDSNPDESLRSGRNRLVTGKFTYFNAYIVILHLLIIAFLGIAVARGFGKGNPPLANGASWSPALDFLEYELNDRHALKHHNTTLFAGPPSSQQEAAWNRILNPTYFAATEQEMLDAGETVDNAAHVTGGDYLATIGVYHELHCLRQMRLFLYRERYYHNVTEAQENYLHNHLDHCLEALRITIMCHSNTGLYTFAWDPDTPNKPTTRSSARSVCVKWSSIEEWSSSRRLKNGDHVVYPPGWEAATGARPLVDRDVV
ncbi:hypothetical protein NPX13_g1659 [Xylaria arbuscula]|uniref:Uncharacterized protein n=1 Tax=Xylaria arbuscula TaxID=114810 RepID=A0A9W8NLJ5_9PEZI|nr:hypothetical protein NPX13_g1659 [Xylaria arbuscula]